MIIYFMRGGMMMSHECFDPFSCLNCIMQFMYVVDKSLLSGRNTEIFLGLFCW